MPFHTRTDVVLEQDAGDSEAQFLLGLWNMKGTGVKVMHVSMPCASASVQYSDHDLLACLQFMSVVLSVDKLSVTFCHGLVLSVDKLSMTHFHGFPFGAIKER